jgi:hypothetical protein
VWYTYITESDMLRKKKKTLSMHTYTCLSKNVRMNRVPVPCIRDFPLLETKSEIAYIGLAKWTYGTYNNKKRYEHAQIPRLLKT